MSSLHRLLRHCIPLIYYFRSYIPLYLIIISFLFTGNNVQYGWHGTRPCSKFQSNYTCPVATTNFQKMWDGTSAVYEAVHVEHFGS